MGMSATQFFQVVLLPQGEFARFLRADAKDKEALLQKLFGTDRFRKVEDWLADRRRATDKEVAAAEAGVTQLVAQIAQAAGSPVPAAAAPAGKAWAAALAATAAAEQDTAAGLVAARRADLEATLDAQRRAEQLADRQRRRRDALRRRADLEAATPEITRAGRGRRRCARPARNGRRRPVTWRHFARSPARPTRRTRPPRRRVAARPRWPTTLS